MNLILVVAKYFFARTTEMQLFKFWRIERVYISVADLIESLLSFVALTNYVVPISLYVTMETMKMINSNYLEWDMQIYDAERDVRAKSNTSDLIENLGQIEHIFSDKTGTLTENLMTFEYCSVGGRLYCHSERYLGEVSSRYHKLIVGLPIHPYQGKPFNLLDVDDLEILLLVMSLCHSARTECKKCSTVLTPDNLEQCPHDPLSCTFLASSPDELAFLEASKDCGVLFRARNADEMVLNVGNDIRKFKIIEDIPWNPDRRKMSVTLKDCDSGVAFMLMKGAEAEVIESCFVDSQDVTTKSHLRLLSEDGYRVMACAFKIIKEKDMETGKEKLNLARTCVDFEEREKSIQEAAAVFESGCRLIGATAVEDKLQYNVSETLTDLANAGIKRWVLTGDREETAINVCRAAKLFSARTSLLKLTRLTTLSDCTAQIAECTETILKANKLTEFGVVLDGPSLALMLQVYPKQLLQLTTHSSVIAVLGCRLSPLQKAQMVSLVRNSDGHPVCAAIGDGANDVSMILEADVGIAIIGSEGMLQNLFICISGEIKFRHHFKIKIRFA